MFRERIPGVAPCSFINKIRKETASTFVVSIEKSTNVGKENSTSNSSHLTSVPLNLGGYLGKTDGAVVILAGACGAFFFYSIIVYYEFGNGNVVLGCDIVAAHRSGSPSKRSRQGT